VAIRRDASAPGYVSEYALQPLEAVAAKTRVMDDAFINASGNDVTPAFVDYLRPLLGSGLPQAERLRGRAVAKRLVP
jgi:6-phosphofructokinase 1